jgi:hypothetical protein
MQFDWWHAHLAHDSRAGRPCQLVKLHHYRGIHSQFEERKTASLSKVNYQSVEENERGEAFDSSIRIIVSATRAQPEELENRRPDSRASFPQIV